jgi:hypothetical protein
MEGKTEDAEKGVSHIFVITHNRVKIKTFVKGGSSIQSCYLYAVT